MKRQRQFSNTHFMTDILHKILATDNKQSEYRLVEFSDLFQVYIVQHDGYKELCTKNLQPVPNSRGEDIKFPQDCDNYIRITKDGKQRAYSYKNGTLIPVY